MGCVFGDLVVVIDKQLLDTVLDSMINGVDILDRIRSNCTVLIMNNFGINVPVF